MTTPPTRPSWRAAAAVTLFSGLSLGVVAVGVGGEGPGSQPGGVESDEAALGADDDRSPAPTSALRLDEPIGLLTGLGVAWASFDGVPAASGTAAPVGVRATEGRAAGPSTTAAPRRTPTTAPDAPGSGTPVSPTPPGEAPSVARPPTAATPTTPAPARTASPAMAGTPPRARETSATTSPGRTAPARTAPVRTSPTTSPAKTTPTTSPATTPPATTSPPTTEAGPPSTTAPTVPPSTSPPKDRDERGNKGGRSDEAHRDRDERRQSARDDEDDD